MLAAVQRKMDMLIDHSLAPATRKTRSQSLPCSDQLLCLFLSSGAGQRGSSYAKALVSGIRSWHVRNGYNWTPSLRLQLVIRGLDSLRLRNRGNKKARLPVTPRMVHILVEAWRKGSNKEKCALACALTAWFGQLRLGEILPSNAREIDLSRLPKRSDWQIIGNLNKSSKLHLPWTKTQRWDGDVVHLVEQNRHFNATQAIKRHLNSSQLNMREPLCAYLEGTHTWIRPIHGPFVPHWRHDYVTACRGRARCGEKDGTVEIGCLRGILEGAGRYLHTPCCERLRLPILRASSLSG